MLRADQAERVRALLRRGFTERAIVERTGVSRGSIQRIRHGTWQPNRHRRRPPRDEGIGVGPLGRCPTCRRRVRLPCRACWLAAHLRRARWRPDAAPDERLELELRGEVRQRYERVKAARDANHGEALESWQLAEL